MSVFSSEMSHAIPDAPRAISVQEVYQLTHNAGTEFGIEGYTCPKNVNYVTREHKIPTDKRKDALSDAQKKAKDPDPTKYAETKEQNLKRHWEKPYGKFLNGKRKTEIDEMVKRCKSVPAPGHYFKENKKVSDITKEIKLGKFDKGQRLNFLTTTESYAEEVPDAGKYKPNYDFVAEKNPKWNLGKPKQPKKVEKAVIGPGKYHDGIEIAMKKSVLKSSRSYSVPRNKPVGALSMRAQQTKFVPGVGAYPDSEQAYSKFHVMKKGRMAVILPYKTQSFTDIVIKSAS